MIAGWEQGCRRVRFGSLTPDRSAARVRRTGLEVRITEPPASAPERSRIAPDRPRISGSGHRQARRGLRRFLPILSKLAQLIEFKIGNGPKIHTARIPVHNVVS